MLYCGGHACRTGDENNNRKIVRRINMKTADTDKSKTLKATGIPKTIDDDEFVRHYVVGDVHFRYPPCTEDEDEMKRCAANGMLVEVKYVKSETNEPLVRSVWAVYPT